MSKTDPVKRKKTRESHHHHTTKCLKDCDCKDCYCRDVPLDQFDWDDDDLAY